LTKVFYPRRISRLFLRRRLSIDRDDGRALLAQIPARRENRCRAIKTSASSRASMFKCVSALIAAATIALTAAPAHAGVTVAIDKSTQQMTVSVNGQPTYQWPVSTARAAYTTPNGVYHPQSVQRSHFSSMYHNSPMPHSIFFRGGYAIHGSYETSRLGGPASHGCVRLDPSHAAALYDLVSRDGAGGTTILISGSHR
jgi:lipoprotein-anchoring transpeptidase ErfK/SrfK